MSNDVTPKTGPDPDPAAPAAQPAAPPSPPQSQLVRRVVKRIAELEAALERFADNPAHRKQISAIRLALKGAQDTMNLSGGRTGHMEAAHMTSWLANTQYLV